MGAQRIVLIRLGLPVFGLVIPFLFNSCSGGFKSFSSSQSNVALEQPISFDSRAIPEFARDSVTVVGKCIRGRGLSLSVDGVAEPTERPCDGGVFSAEVALPGDDGLKQIVLSQVDLTGREIKDSVGVTKDTLAPGVVIATVDRLVTPAGAHSVAGTCENGFELTLTGDVASVLTGLTCVNGVFQISVNLTSGDGIKNLTVKQTDKAGNVGQGSKAVTVDTVAPALVATTPVMNAVVRDRVTVTGTCETGLPVSAAGTGLLAPIETPCESASFDFSSALSAGDGPKEIVLSQTDAQGNRGEHRRTVIRDTTAPIVTITAPLMNAAVGSNLNLAGTCEAGLNVRISSSALAQTLSVACANSTFSTALTLGGVDGSISITASQTDAAGNLGSAAVTVVKDTSAPTLTLSTPTANSFAMATVVASGTCESPYPVVVSGAGVSQPGQIVCNSGVFQATLNLSAGDGTKLLIFAQTDAAGNSSQVSVTITKDTVAPVLTVTAPANGTVYTAESISISGTCETAIVVQISGTGAASPMQLNCVNSSYSGNLVLSAGNGSKALEFRQSDPAGNVTSIQRSVTLNVPATVLAITAPAASSFTKGSVTLQGICETGRDVSISGNVAATVTTSCTNSAFSVLVNLSAGDGLKTVQISQLQSTGMTAMDSRGFIKDTVAPSVRVSLPVAGAAFQSSLVLSGTCETDLPVTINGTGVLNMQTASCVNSVFSTSVVLSAGDGNKVINVGADRRCRKYGD